MAALVDVSPTDLGAIGIRMFQTAHGLMVIWPASVIHCVDNLGTPLSIDDDPTVTDPTTGSLYVDNFIASQHLLSGDSQFLNLGLGSQFSSVGIGLDGRTSTINGSLTVHRDCTVSGNLTVVGLIRKWFAAAVAAYRNVNFS